MTKAEHLRRMEDREYEARMRRAELMDFLAACILGGAGIAVLLTLLLLRVL